ncbi:MAG: hypothetical protein V4673_14340 [Pseudomonadota bacterium]
MMGQAGKPDCLDCVNGICDMNCGPARTTAAAAGGFQQLVARIKRTSKYAYQAPAGGWFDVRVVPDMGYGLRGNDNNYRFSDVVFGIRLDDGHVVELRSK